MTSNANAVLTIVYRYSSSDGLGAEEGKRPMVKRISSFTTLFRRPEKFPRAQLFSIRPEISSKGEASSISESSANYHNN